MNSFSKPRKYNPGQRPKKGFRGRRTGQRSGQRSGRRSGRIDLPKLVRRIVHRHVPAEARCLLSLRDHWKEIVGERVAAKTMPMLVRQKTLFVEVASAQWRHELLYMQSMLLERINQHLSNYEIQTLQWKNANRGGFISASQAQTLVRKRLIAKDPPPPALSRPEPLPAAPPSATLAAIEEIQDPTLRRLAINARLALGPNKGT